jgi:hypothetical protein
MVLAHMISNFINFRIKYKQVKIISYFFENDIKRKSIIWL